MQQQEEDFSKPVSLSNNLFSNLDAPKQNLIKFGKKQILEQVSDKPTASLNNQKKNLYQMNQNEDEQDDQDVFQLKLTQIDQPKQKQLFKSFSQDKKMTKVLKQIQSTQNSNESSTDSIKNNNYQSKTVSNSVAQRYKKSNANRKKKNQAPKQKVQVDIDAQIGQVGQWAQRGMGIEKSDQSDFDNEDENFDQIAKNNINTKVDRQKNDQIRKRIQQKVKNMQSNPKKQQKGLGLGGLAAKAEQLRRKKQQQQKFKQIRNKQNSSQAQQTSHHNLIAKKTQQNIKQIKPIQKARQQEQQQDQEDDPWEKVNQQTKMQYEQKKQKTLTKQDILDYYKNTFKYIQEDLIHQIQFDLGEQEEIGCWQALFACFKQDNNQKDKSKKQNQKQHNNKNEVAVRLLAISKTGLANTEQQFFILKFIWDKLTNKKFIRYGNHWNEIGFQGRDPQTDLRSTGILSLLQWFQFIDQNQKLSKQIYELSIQKQIPLALTHIKITGLFLSLLKCGKINQKSSNKQNIWKQYQKIYNCLVYKTFNKFCSPFKGQINIGQRLDQIIESIRKNYNKKMYLKQYTSNRGLSKNEN